jgi:hypothetical protein
MNFNPGVESPQDPGGLLSRGPMRPARALRKFTPGVEIPKGPGGALSRGPLPGSFGFSGPGLKSRRTQAVHFLESQCAPAGVLRNF